VATHINIDSIDYVRNIDPLTIDHVKDIAPLTIQKIAPAAVHIKELNQIAPLSVESLRVDHVRHVDPLRVERFDVTHLPTVNLSLSQIPSLDLNVRRVPPVTIAIGQQFELPSRYTMRTKFLGFEVLRIEIDGRTRIVPQDRARREQSRAHERSFPDVAAAGNPAIPTKVIEKGAEAVTRAVPPPHAATDSSRMRSNAAPQFRAAAAARAPPPAWPVAPRAPLNAGAPRFHYSIAKTAEPAHSTVSAVSSGS
jgi:hypothetical protein